VYQLPTHAFERKNDVYQKLFELALLLSLCP
jgi:hypothetical protein